MTKKIVIIGAGWLGEALAQRCLSSGWQVQATHRRRGEQSHERQFVINERGELEHDLDLTDAFWLCAMTPGSRNPNSNYLQSLEAALALYQTLHGRGFVLCSSSGIYPQQSGDYKESSELTLSSERQQRLFAAEQRVLQQGGRALRLGGLIGPKREPGRFVSGKALSSHGDDVVNMVHRDDVIDGILQLLSHYEQTQSVYNLVHPQHPTKQQYYRDHCQRLGNEPPTFTNQRPIKRRIDGSAIEQLGFSYQQPI
ncbi:MULTISPECIES: NADP-binding protein [Pseudoalteromonas]|uniref:NADP-binding protein n=1 Tax=Pseudoalteromonas ruthenica TaxID=151081 RepID=A0A0F4PUH9_9GAMM|nr:MULTISPECIES: NADP-binding protein [Pseudoalteromonas]KJY95107.1 NADP-binding protein [Pseudoalteromonas ruthenica]KJY98789.1 NADP-binding protein [Pseudoalteromonas ruthenica]MCF2861934.1 NADP-binding protein [Pseudoalteromonas sp. CNAT2-18]MCG7559693.1 NADP-binding protein [Pseudoalteromonas sp. CNAT2-18.1]TMO85956.1 NADP-binding protein [Pseudoalteromonas ruthenica]